MQLPGKDIVTKCPLLGGSAVQGDNYSDPRPAKCSQMMPVYNFTWTNTAQLELCTSVGVRYQDLVA